MPHITLDLTLFATAFVTVLVIMDPIGNIPIFLALTKGQTLPQRRRAAALASTVAGAVIHAYHLAARDVHQLIAV
jgi:multiple antibiotic resistance protein